jgi:hypothetical protein
MAGAARRTGPSSITIIPARRITNMKRALYTLSAAAALLGAVPATTLADAASELRQADKASCQCAGMRAHANVGAAAGRDDGAPKSEAVKVTAQDEEFLRQVWGAP